jgi:vacuolar iron transporter family protein
MTHSNNTINKERHPEMMESVESEEFSSRYLKEAITGEYNASKQYESYSKIAGTERYPNTAILYKALAEAEMIHINNHQNALKDDFKPVTSAFETGSTLENLTSSIAGEEYEYKQMYPQFRKAIKSTTSKQQNRVAMLSMKWAMDVEKNHSKLLKLALKAVKKGEDFDLLNLFVCQICGNIEVSSTQPESYCPVCGHDSSFYKPVKSRESTQQHIDFLDNFHLQGGEIIRQITFGMNDGVVSIFALLAGVAGAGQPPHIILITLLAATVAGALSMAAGEFISNKSENDYYNHEISQERLEIKLIPEIEKEEIRKIYRKKGFRGNLLEQVVDKITEDEDLWAREMVIDELGVTELEHKSELKSAIVIFFAFLVGACFPVLPYLLLLKSSLKSMSIFYTATIVTVVGLFIAGAMKKFVTGVNWFKSGIEMLLVGACAYGISYLIGSFIPF